MRYIINYEIFSLNISVSRYYHTIIGKNKKKIRLIIKNDGTLIILRNFAIIMRC